MTNTQKFLKDVGGILLSNCKPKVQRRIHRLKSPSSIAAYLATFRERHRAKKIISAARTAARRAAEAKAKLSAQTSPTPK